MNKRSAKGLTLIELMVVVAVMGIVLAVATPSFTDMMNKRRVQLIANELSNDLAYARSEGGLRNKVVGLSFGGSEVMTCYTISVFVIDKRCECLAPGKACSSNIELRTAQIPALMGVTLEPNEAITSSLTLANTLAFSTPNRNAEPAGSAIRIVGKRGYVLEVRVNALGRVRVCAPDGKFGGVASC